MNLRPYQKEAVKKMLWSLNIEGNSLVSLPTGCLAQGTPILLDNGSTKPVEEVKRGDKVVSYDNFNNKNVTNNVSEVFRTSIKPKPMIELVYEDETITVTYDHPFFNGEAFHPLYQLAWGEMEASQREKLKLLCKQYGANFDNQSLRGKLSCCNETCSRCRRILENDDGWKDSEGSPDSRRKLVGEPTRTSCGEPHQRGKRRQPCREHRMVHGKVQRLGRSKNRKNKNTDTPAEREARAFEKTRNKGLLHKKYRGEVSKRKEDALRPLADSVPPSNETNSLQNSHKSIMVKEAKPYYSICLQKAPYTYYIGEKHRFVTHNSGKSHVIASFVQRANKNIIILTPSREILEQDLDKLSKVVEKDEIGVFSASMNSKTVKKYTLATIQSAYKHPELFNQFDIAVIDESDMLNPKKLDGMHQKFFRKAGLKKVIGLSATIYRMDSYYRRWGRAKWQVETVTTIKMLPRYQDRFWKQVIHVTNTQELIEAGYLTPLTYFDETMIPQEMIRFNKSKSDFNLEDFTQQYIPFLDKTANLISNMKEKSVLVFCATIEQAEMLQREIPGSRIVTGETKKKERKEIVEGFRDGEIRVVLNVGVLLVGFDKPDLESIVIARPTRSLRLHVQMLGRGTRIAEGKTTCNVYDLVGNVATMGRVETIKTEKIANARGNLMWNVTSETMPEGFHYATLYSYKLQPKEEEE